MARRPRSAPTPACLLFEHRGLTGFAARRILNLMVKYSEDELDTLFAALSDRTRRHVLQSLSEGEGNVTELAQAHDMSLPGFMKHLRVLENAGLIARSNEGRGG